MYTLPSVYLHTCMLYIVQQLNMCSLYEVKEKHIYMTVTVPNKHSIRHFRFICSQTVNQNRRQFHESVKNPNLNHIFCGPHRKQHLTISPIFQLFFCAVDTLVAAEEVIGAIEDRAYIRLTFAIACQCREAKQLELLYNRQTDRMYDQTNSLS